jgi:hypothetical protein
LGFSISHPIRVFSAFFPFPPILARCYSKDLVFIHLTSSGGNTFGLIAAVLGGCGRQPFGGLGENVFFLLLVSGLDK